jgi:hypothetical protein
MHLEIRADLLGSDRDLELLGRCLEPLAGAGHQVQIRVEVGPGATARQIDTLLSWLDPIEGAVWRLEKRQAPPALGSGLIYDLAVNVGSELVTGLLLAPRLRKLANTLKGFRRSQPVPVETSIVLSCDTRPDAANVDAQDTEEVQDPDGAGEPRDGE